MVLRLADRQLEPGYLYFDRYVHTGLAGSNEGAFPAVHPDGQVHDSILGPWTRVGARTSLSEVAMGAYSYIVNDSSAAYSTIGKFCSIARDVRINPGNHPTWRAAQHHFSYRARSYDLGPEDDDEFFEWRRSHAVTLGHDVWIGDDVIILSGVTVGHGVCIGAGSIVTRDLEPYTVCAGVACRKIKNRYNEDVIKLLLDIQWWNWPDDTIKANKRFFNMNLNNHTVEEIQAAIV